MIKAKELVQQYRSNPAVTLSDLKEALRRGRRGEPGGVRPEDFSLRDLAAHAICDRQSGEPIGLSLLEQWCTGRLVEAEGTLTTSLVSRRDSLTSNSVPGTSTAGSTAASMRDHSSPMPFRHSKKRASARRPRSPTSSGGSASGHPAGKRRRKSFASWRPGTAPVSITWRVPFC